VQNYAKHGISYSHKAQYSYRYAPNKARQKTTTQLIND